MFADLLYALTPRDGQATFYGLVAQNPNPFSRSSASANLQDVYTMPTDLPRAWSPKQIFVVGSGGGAQTVSRILAFIADPGGNGVHFVYDESGLAAGTVRRAITLPTDLWFDSRYHPSLRIEVQFSAGAVANSITTTVCAQIAPVGNLSQGSFLFSANP